MNRFFINKYTGKHINLLLFGVFIVLLLSFAVKILVTLDYRKNQISQLCKVDTLKISDQITHSFSYIEKSLNFIARKILAKNYHDFYYVENVLIKSTRFPRYFKTIFSWSSFKFVNSDGNIVVDSVRGVINNPQNIRDTSFFNAIKSSPWRLSFQMMQENDNPLQQNINIGYGFTNAKQQFVGAVLIHLNMLKLQQIIEQHITNNHLFILIDDNYNMLLNNVDKEFILNDKKFIRHLDKLLMDNNFGIFSPCRNLFNIEVNSFKKISHTPFILLLGHKDILSPEMIYLLKIDMFYLTIVIIALMIIFIYLSIFFITPIMNIFNFHNLITKKGKSDSNLVKTTTFVDLAGQINKISDYTTEIEKIQNDLITAKKTIENATLNLEENRCTTTNLLSFTNFIFNCYHLYFISKIKEFNSDHKKIQLSVLAHINSYLKMLTNDLFTFFKEEVLNVDKQLDKIKLKDLFEECFFVLKQEIDDKFIKITVNYDAEYQFKVNRYRLYHIMLSVLYDIIQATPQLAKVNIEVSVKEQVLHAVFVDQRFRITEQGLSNSIDKHNSFITAVANALDGSISINDIKDIGRKYFISIPIFD